MSIAQDYAKMATPSQALHGGNRRTKKSLPAWAWIFLGLFAGIVGSGLFFLQADKHSTEATKIQVTAKAAKPQITQIKHEEKAGRKFDYYTILPQQNPKLEEEPSTFFIQIANFVSYAKADTLKATIALNGIKTKIEATVAGEHNQYVVYLGPYSSLEIAQAAQKHLSKSNIKSEIVNKLQQS